MTAIRVHALGKRYGHVRALDHVSFEVGTGEIVAVLGPNGAGKTTAVEILEGFQSPSEGDVSVLGADPANAGPEWRARVGLVMQSTSLDPQLSVREALSAFASVFPHPRAVDELVVMTGLEDQADTRIGRLSGGQQRRVDLAIGIAGRPDVLFLDEPTTGLDPAARRQTWSVVEKLRGDGTTILLTTHHMEEAERLADRLIVLDHGRVVADTTPGRLRARSALTTIRWPAHDLVVRTKDPRAVLERLVHLDVDLTGLEVGPPDLEDAYLELTS
jgi:ABC-2 type transport system ATP-binding protein